MSKFSKRGQVWIETVIYTLIAFILIAAVLAFVRPKIQEIQDKAIIDQSISLMKDLDATILEIVQGGSGNKRVLETSIKKGDLLINAIDDEIDFDIESKYVYSEPGKEINDGNLVITTTKMGDLSIVNINRIYDDYNVTFAGSDANKIISKAATPYKLSVYNRGKKGDPGFEKWQIDIEVT
jgi:hypothetical protein